MGGIELIYLINETYFGINTRTIKFCNNMHEVVMFLNLYKPKGQLTIEKVVV